MHLPPVSAVNTVTYSPAYVRSSIHAISLGIRAASMAISWRRAQSITLTSGNPSLFDPYLVWATI